MTDTYIRDVHSKDAVVIDSSNHVTCLVHTLA